MESKDIKYNNIILFAVPWGNYWDHVSEIWMKRNESNILFLKYEDLRNVSN